jgi:uncharacterized protein YwbE
MQDDGARSERFAPYYGNTGFFFARSNPRTAHFMQVRGHGGHGRAGRASTSDGAGHGLTLFVCVSDDLQMLLFSWELVIGWQSHQSVFTFLLQDHFVRDGLSVKILPEAVAPTGKVVSGTRTHAHTSSRAHQNGSHIRVYMDVCMYSSTLMHA